MMDILQQIIFKAAAGDFLAPPPSSPNLCAHRSLPRTRTPTMVRFVLCLLASASATVLPRSGATPLLALRGSAYPPPKAGYHALAAKGAAATKQTVVPNLLSGALAGGYVAVRRAPLEQYRPMPGRSLAATAGRPRPMPPPCTDAAPDTPGRSSVASSR